MSGRYTSTGIWILAKYGLTWTGGESLGEQDILAGHFFLAYRHCQVYSASYESKVPLTPANEPPKADFSILPLNPDAKEYITFNASSSKDPCGKIERYIWEFGDGISDENTTAIHNYSIGGEFEAILRVYDYDGLSDSHSLAINVNGLPIPYISIRYDDRDARVPVIGENITFDAIGSRDEDGRITGYEWNFDDEEKAASPRLVHQFDRGGYHTINLTVFDDRGALNTTYQRIRINRPPHAEISFTPIRPNATDEIAFNASMSSDADGEIQEYRWNFGDGSADSGPNVLHVYKKEGNYTVKLVIKDNDGAESESSSLIRINKTLEIDWLEKGNDLFQKGKCDEAIKAYNISYAINRLNSMALFGKGRAYFAKGNYDEALLWLAAAIEQSPQLLLSNSEYAEMWIYKANALEWLGLYREADDAFSKAEELDSSSQLIDVVESCSY